MREDDAPCSGDERNAVQERQVVVHQPFPVPQDRIIIVDRPVPVPYQVPVPVERLIPVHVPVPVPVYHPMPVPYPVFMPASTVDYTSATPHHLCVTSAIVSPRGRLTVPIPALFPTAPVDPPVLALSWEEKTYPCSPRQGRGQPTRR